MGKRINFETKTILHPDVIFEVTKDFFQSHGYSIKDQYSPTSVSFKGGSAGWTYLIGAASWDKTSKKLNITFHTDPQSNYTTIYLAYKVSQWRLWGSTEKDASRELNEYISFIRNKETNREYNEF